MKMKQYLCLIFLDSHALLQSKETPNTADTSEAALKIVYNVGLF